MEYVPPAPSSPVTPSPMSYTTANGSDASPSPFALGTAHSFYKEPATPTRTVSAGSQVDRSFQNFSFRPPTPDSPSAPRLYEVQPFGHPDVPLQGDDTRSRLQSPPPVATPGATTFGSPLTGSSAGHPPAYQSPTLDVHIGMHASPPATVHPFVTFTDPFAPSTSAQQVNCSPRSTPQTAASSSWHASASTATFQSSDAMARSEGHDRVDTLTSAEAPQTPFTPSPHGRHPHHQPHPSQYGSPPPLVESPTMAVTPSHHHSAPPQHVPPPSQPTFARGEVSPTSQAWQDPGRTVAMNVMAQHGFAMSRDSSLESLPSWTSWESGLSAATGSTSVHSGGPGLVEGRWFKADERGIDPASTTGGWTAHDQMQDVMIEDDVLSPPVPEHPSIQFQLSSAPAHRASTFMPPQTSPSHLSPNAAAPPPNHGAVVASSPAVHYPDAAPPPPFSDFDPNAPQTQPQTQSLPPSATSTGSGASRPISPSSTVAPSGGSEAACSDSHVGVDLKGERFGITLGDFDIERTLGTGTFGKVLLVRFRGAPDGSGKGLYYAMKVLNKVEVVRLKQVEHINSEKDLLALVSGATADSPASLEEEQGNHFCVRLNCTFQDERNIYLLLDFVEGGELFTALRKAGRFTSDVARFFAASICLGLRALHKRNIVYRDLKPENILLARNGYVKITDFGFAKRVPDRTYTLCGTPEYLAPEIIQAKGHGTAADWWSFGVLLFELLAGYPPFFDDSPFKIYEKIVAGRVAYPRHFDPLAKDLISKLLVIDRSKRLGNLKGGSRDVIAHPWFAGVPWEHLYRQQVPAPIVPRVRSAGDASYFERYPDVSLEELPGMHRAVLNRLHGGRYTAPEVGSDPYRHMFETF